MVRVRRRLRLSLLGRGLGALLLRVGIIPLTGCQAETVTYACPDSCIQAAYATFELACSPNDLTSVVATGPCAVQDAGLSYFTGGTSEWTVAVGSAEAGACHVQLEFATGFTYAQDVTFTSQPDPSPKGCTPCPSFIGPTGGPWTVNNPSETCVAAPLDAGSMSAVDAAAE
jgi:hypothetical protein